MLSSIIIENIRQDGLLQITPEATTGLATPYWANAAEISNKGFELSINTINISNKDFSWTTNFNMLKTSTISKNWLRLLLCNMAAGTLSFKSRVIPCILSI
jgi:hypothetical protein